jgi:hypothetical protein
MYVTLNSNLRDSIFHNTLRIAVSVSVLRIAKENDLYTFRKGSELFYIIYSGRTFVQNRRYDNFKNLQDSLFVLVRYNHQNCCTLMIQQLHPPPIITTDFLNSISIF